MVHLFEWKWKDIALECEQYLAPNNFCGVQVSPPVEHVILPNDNYPWWQRYQPASYRLYSRSGTEAEFIDMVHRCNKVGVRIYVDAVINHMAGLDRKGVADGGSSYDSTDPANLQFPGVPFTTEHFTPRSMCPSGDGNVNNYGDPNNVRNCYLVGLTDLYGALPYVRDACAGYFNHLIEIGVAGIRIDAAKHMWPADIAAILAKLNPLPTDQGFPAGSKFYVFQEVIDQNDGAIKVDEYYDMGYVTEFRYCQKIGWGIQNYGQLANLVDYGWGMAVSERAFIFVDNHDNQRGHGGGGSILTYQSPRDYKQAQAYTLAQDYGFTRIMSSYDFGTNSDQGPPSDANGRTKDVSFNSDGSCAGGWVCEHRWNVQRKMVQFRNAVAGTSMDNYYNDGGAVAFSRGNKGFFAMAKNGNFQKTLATGLPAGTYCNIIDDCASSVTVDASGMGSISINNYEEPILALCPSCPDLPPLPTSGPTASTPSTTPGSTLSTASLPTLGPGVKRTVIFIQKQTNPGQDLFIRGGIDATRRPPCIDITSDCCIPFKTNSLGTGTPWAGYDGWRVGDTKLDWFGAETSQGSFGGIVPQGSPVAWTSSSATNPSYQTLNTWGDHHWMIDFDMDCSLTEGGWFEVKTFGTGGIGWEADIAQTSCLGTAGGSAPYTSKNHLARCGYINKFSFGTAACEINTFPA